MNTQEVVRRSSVPADKFDRHERRSDGLQFIDSLCGGLTLIRDAFYARVHRDVEVILGVDSLFYPISEEKTERTTKLEIESYQVVVSATAAKAKGYISDGGWYRRWLAQVRLGELDVNSRAALRISYYASKSPNDQRLAFSNVLAQVLPESGRAPLVLLKLLPLAVSICTAQAFGNSVDALAWRREQEEIMPSIADCHECRGGLLENGEHCPACGNPLWNFDWLNGADG